MSEVRLEKIHKYFAQFAAVRDVSLTFPSQSTTCLLGPSGCGKTTLLRMIAGLETVSSGRIWIGEQDVTNLSARRRNIAMVFQSPIIYRGLSVYENIELPLRELRLSPSERRARVQEAVALLGLEASLNQDPNNFDNGTGNGWLLHGRWPASQALSFLMNQLPMWMLERSFNSSRT